MSRSYKSKRIRHVGWKDKKHHQKWVNRQQLWMDHDRYFNKE